ncbi:MAG: hypothetical protein [Chaetfec virus UA24_244]|nr:MAG: hypothetical protein [Chaetfec virus UA24_244]
MAGTKKKRKPEILTTISTHNGRPASVVRFEYVDNEFRQIGVERYIDHDELTEFQKKVCKSIGRTASELPGFQ